MWRPVTLLKHGAFSAVLFLLVFCVWFLGEHSSSDVMAVRQVRRENEDVHTVDTVVQIHKTGTSAWHSVQHEAPSSQFPSLSPSTEAVTQGEKKSNARPKQEIANSMNETSKEGAVVQPTDVITDNPIKWRCNKSVNLPTEETPDLHHYKMVVSILSAKRTPPTVVTMARQLLEPVKRTDYKFLVSVSLSASCAVDVIRNMSELGFTVHVHREQYRELAPDKVRITYDDSLERVLWRTSHVLDYAYMLEKTLEYNSDYILILEDDMKPSKLALDKTYAFAKEQFRHKYQDWGYLTLFSNRIRRVPVTKATRDGSSGACALIIKRDLIPDLIQYLRDDPYAAPVDLALYHFIESKKRHIYERTPNLFQHISPHSSYLGEDQKDRNTERTRSLTYRYDEDNKIFTSIPLGYVGCFKDKSGAQERDLIGRFALASDGPKNSKSAIRLCASFCKFYQFYALQNGGDCYCGNEFGQYGQAPKAECDMACQKDTQHKCGGKLRNSVYKK